MRWWFLFVGVSMMAQTPAPKPFAATAELGKPYVIGEDVDDYGQIKVDYAKKFEVTLESAELALRFANRRELVLAGAGQKLVILRGRRGICRLRLRRIFWAVCRSGFGYGSGTRGRGSLSS